MINKDLESAIWLDKELASLHFQRRKLSSWFDNLYENKVIYQGSYIALVSLSEFGDFYDGFSATSKICKTIYCPDSIELGSEINMGLYQFKEIQFEWKGVEVDDDNQKIYEPKDDFTIWTEPSFVKYIDKLIEYGDFEDALRIINS